LAVKVLKDLKDEGLDVQLCMIGPEKDGSLERTKKLAKKLNVKVDFTGRLSKKEWHNKAKDFNVFINTTTIDNAPVSVIEAMALGLPIVSTNVGGMSFLIENEKNGLLVEPDNVECFVSAIKVLVFNSGKSQKMAEKAREKAENYNWEKVKEQWCNLLR
jgi:glycosyltransferase involved in cell wall biosynthesis